MIGFQFCWDSSFYSYKNYQVEIILSYKNFQIAFPRLKKTHQTEPNREHWSESSWNLPAPTPYPLLLMPHNLVLILNISLYFLFTLIPLYLYDTSWSPMVVYPSFLCITFVSFGKYVSKLPQRFLDKGRFFFNIFLKKDWV